LELPSVALLAGCCLVASLALAGPTAPDGPPPRILGLMELRQDFHLAATIGDADLMRSLWTDDAVFNGGGNVITGGDEITAFLQSSPLWGTAVNLTSESKAEFVVTGNFAHYGFECILVRVDSGDPLDTSLSSIPPGAQNPGVEIVQHSHTTGTAVYEDGHWKFQEFNGAGGPL
jgi:hypothetical protein